MNNVCPTSHGDASTSPEAAMSLMVLSVLGKVTGAMAKAKDFDSGFVLGPEFSPRGISVQLS